MMAQCTAHAQLKSVYGVSRVTCHRESGPPIFMSKVREPGVEASDDSKSNRYSRCTMYYPQLSQPGQLQEPLAIGITAVGILSVHIT